MFNVINPQFFVYIIMYMILCIWYENYVQFVVNKTDLFICVSLHIYTFVYIALSLSGDDAFINGSFFSQKKEGIGEKKPLLCYPFGKYIIDT